MNAAHGKRRGGFTLLEMLAVVAIIGLVAGLAYPNLGGLGDQSLRDQARLLAAELELARERTLATGLRYRMVLDLDGARYWTEREIPAADGDAASLSLVTGPRPIRPPPWLLRPNDPEPASEHIEDSDEAEPRLAEAGPAMAAPRRVELGFEPPGDRSGRPQALDAELAFSGVELETSFVDRGLFWVSFEPDGSTEAARILISRPDGSGLALEVAPLADAVRIVEERS